MSSAHSLFRELIKNTFIKKKELIFKKFHINKFQSHFEHKYSTYICQRDPYELFYREFIYSVPCGLLLISALLTWLYIREIRAYRDFARHWDAITPKNLR